MVSRSNKKKDLSRAERKTQLKKLIEEAKTLKFDSKLINKYKHQLAEIEAEIQKEKDKQEKFKSQPIQYNEVNPVQIQPRKRDFSTPLNFPNLPEGELIFIDCSECHRVMKRQSLEDDKCTSCKEKLQEVIA